MSQWCVSVSSPDTLGDDVVFLGPFGSQEKAQEVQKKIFERELNFHNKHWPANEGSLVSSNGFIGVDTDTGCYPLTFITVHHMMNVEKFFAREEA